MELLVIDRLIDILLFNVLQRTRLLLANRIGLGMPFVERLAKDGTNYMLTLASSFAPHVSNAAVSR